MVDAGASNVPRDRLAILEWVDQVADRFDASWKAGSPPRISDYIGDAPGEGRTVLLRELVRIDLERRAKAGERRSWEDYSRDFPELLDADDGSADDFSWVAPSSGMSASANGVSTPLFSDLPGPTIAGYEIIGLLGQGGMGAVYKAKQTSLKRLVALKVIRPGSREDPRHEARLRAEAEAAASLQHPNIVQVYEVGQQHGVSYIALELVEGGTLAQKLGGKPLRAHESASLLEALARAVHFAHERGVIHRDLKPANVLLTPGGTPKIVDFGLAKQQAADTGQTMNGAILGTPSYMAPEQAEGGARAAGPAADIYSLGAILYEMLTGGPPFRGATLLDTLEQVRSEEPVPPRRLQPRLPLDLETICLKALSKSPGRRYATAEDLADDLGRFLERKPVLARPVGSAERLWRFCRRRPAAAGLLAATVGLVATVVTASLLMVFTTRARERDQEREAVVQRLQLLRLNPHGDGWSQEAWQLIGKAAVIRRDVPLRNLAVLFGSDYDAQPVRHFENYSVSSLAFAAGGERLLMGGGNDSNGYPMEGAKLWDSKSDELHVSPNPGAGPVAFWNDRDPVQLLPGKHGTLLLQQVAESRPMGRLNFSSTPGASNRFSLQLDELGRPVLALTPAGRLAAAAALDPTGTPIVAVWDTQSPRLILQQRQDAVALALAPAGTFLACSDKASAVSIWSLPDGKLITSLPAVRGRIQSLVFSPDARKLAAGAATGTITLWDVARRLPLAYCDASQEAISALAFSSDGTLLASGGRGPISLWDATTGRLLLNLRSQGVVTALAFAPDGRRLAAGCRGAARVDVWRLEQERGIRTLRGLADPASQFCFSADGSLLAARTHSGRIGVWDLNKGALRLFMESPDSSRDAALTFDPEGSRLALASGDEAILWEVPTGNVLGRWTLPSGSKDALAFPGSGQLFLLRSETVPAASPQGNTSQPNRVCRLRNLLGADPMKPMHESGDFNRHFLGAVASPHGNRFIAEGIQHSASGHRRAITALEAATGEVRWSIESTRSDLQSELVLDSQGELLAARTGNRQDLVILIDTASGRTVETLEQVPIALSARRKYAVHLSPGDATSQPRCNVVVQQSESVSTSIFAFAAAPGLRPAFSKTDNLLAWSNSDGTVSVCCLEDLRRHLSEVSLGW